MTGRERITRAIRGEATDSLPLIPISMMAAAAEIGEPYGRYILDARVHARGQVAFAGRYDIDHVSVISCPTTEAADLGAAIIYYDDQPPAIDETHALLADKRRLASLRVPDPGAGRRMSKRLETVRLLKEAVGGEKLVEGWVEGPRPELRPAGHQHGDARLLRRPAVPPRPDGLRLRARITFARAQVDAGADIIGVGDAAASLVGPQIYRDFVWDYEKKYVAALHGLGVPVRLHICGNINALLPMLADVEPTSSTSTGWCRCGMRGGTRGPRSCSRATSTRWPCCTRARRGASRAGSRNASSRPAVRATRPVPVARSPGAPRRRTWRRCGASPAQAAERRRDPRDP